MPKEDQLVFLMNAGPDEVGGSTQGPSWGYVKVIFKRCCQLLALNTLKMAPRTSQGLQERAWDAPTKGFEWTLR